MAKKKHTRCHETEFIRQEKPGDWVLLDKNDKHVISHHKSCKAAHTAMRAIKWSEGGHKPYAHHHRSEHYTLHGTFKKRSEAVTRKDEVKGSRIEAVTINGKKHYAVIS